MTVKKTFILATALLAAAVTACQKEPSTSGLNRDFVVYTEHDSDARFAAYTSYFLPDSILLMGSHRDTTAYWSSGGALEIIGTLASRLNQTGLRRTRTKEEADLGIQLSFVEEATYYVGYNNPYWWWDYPYYWEPYYWGPYWSGWYAPYQVYYGYTSGSLLIEMLELDRMNDSSRKLPVIWNAFIGGLLTDNNEMNIQQTVNGVIQAVAQSPYLKK